MFFFDIYRNDPSPFCAHLPSKLVIVVFLYDHYWWVIARRLSYLYPTLIPILAP